MEKYFNIEREYTKPTLIKFDKPLTIKLKDLQDYLDNYKPYSTSYVWAYRRVELGDFGNYTDLICESIAISPTFSKVYREKSGIYDAGDTAFEKVFYSWYYRENKPFWKYAMERTYSTDYCGRKYKYIDDVEVSIDGVYVISYMDKQRIEEQDN